MCGIVRIPTSIEPRLGEVEVVRISFLKVMQTVSGLWQFLELTEGMLTSRQVSKVVMKALQQIAKYALGK